MRNPGASGALSSRTRPQADVRARVRRVRRRPRALRRGRSYLAWRRRRQEGSSIYRPGRSGMDEEQERLVLAARVRDRAHAKRAKPTRRDGCFCAKNGWAKTALGGFGLPPTRSEGTRVFGGTGSRRERTQHEAAIPSRDVWGGADGRPPVQGGGSPNRDAPVVRPLEPTIPSRGSANGLVFHPRTIGKRSLGPVAA